MALGLSVILSTPAGSFIDAENAEPSILHNVNRAYRHTAFFTLFVIVAILLSGCAPLPWQTRTATGDTLKRSPHCPCSFSYPTSWYFEAANGDTSKPQLAVHSYNDSSAAHIPIPTRFADIGIDWHPDPTGQLYLAATTRHLAAQPEQVERLTVSGYPATSYAYWTAPPADGGVYEQHIYLWVPEYQLDYDLSLLAANPPGRDVARERAVFDAIVRSLVIGPQPATSSGS